MQVSNFLGMYFFKRILDLDFNDQDEVYLLESLNKTIVKADRSFNFVEKTESWSDFDLKKIHSLYKLQFCFF